ncbi:MAG: dockerin type I domain-containing protein, partial [Bacteroidales bacterium]|nr:dockerin type I domain-containing protein [Bacteroidales bacterium]
PGDYVLEISRQGFLIRYGVVTVTSSGYSMEHREILAGDVNGDLMVTMQDYSTVRSKQGAYQSANYIWKYDFNGNGTIDNADFSLLMINLGMHYTIYKETFDFINNAY